MSANDVLITARNPNCVSAHGACSRELPQPKLSPASRISAPFASRLIQDEVRLRIAVGVVPPVVEQLLVQTLLADRLQEARRDDLVRVDVIDRQRHARGSRNVVNFFM